MGRNAHEIDVLSDAAIAARSQGDGGMIPAAGVDQKGDVAAVHIATVHELHFTAEIFDDALLAQLFPEADFDQLFGRNGHQADGAAHAVHGAGLLQRGGDAQKGGDLAVVAAGVDIAGLRVTVGVSGDDQAVQLAHDQQLGAGLAGVDVGIETGDVPRLHQLIAQFLEFFGQIGVGFPLPIAGLRMLPDVIGGRKHHFPLGSYDFFQLICPFGAYHFDLLLFPGRTPLYLFRFLLYCPPEKNAGVGMEKFPRKIW